jgi:hypothetical protein
MPRRSVPPTPTLSRSRDADAAGGPRSSWFRRLRSRLAVALGFRTDPAGFALGAPTGVGRDDNDGGLGHLMRARKPEVQEALLVEALELLDEADRRVIAARLPGGPYEAVVEAVGIHLEAAGPPYAAAVDRLGQRLVWVVARERSGTSPPERKVLGQAKSCGSSAQEIAQRLRLPVSPLDQTSRGAPCRTPRDPADSEVRRSFSWSRPRSCFQRRLTLNPRRPMRRGMR